MNRNWDKRYCSGLAIFISAIILIISNFNLVFALPNASSITTSPVSVDISTHAGQSVSTQLRVMNNNPSPEQVKVSLAKFKAKGVNGEAQIYKPTADDTSVNWVHFSTTSFIAQPKVWENITMTISIPQMADPGYYYAVLFTPNLGEKPSANNIKGTNAVLVLVNTNSKSELKKLSIASFSTTKSVYQYLPVNFNVLISNEGNIHVIPNGEIFITRTQHGKTIDTLNINSAGGNVLPNSQRIFTASWTNGIPVYQNKVVGGKTITNSKGQPVQALNWNSSKPLSSLRFGKYYAHLVVEYNNGITDVSSDAVLSFWVLPWELLLITIIIIVAAAALFIFIFWKLYKKIFKGINSKVSSRRYRG
jgi:hypothetical protein